MRVLRLGKNALDTLPAAALEQLRQLEELDLSHNFIEAVASNALAGLSTLTIVDLSNSPNLIRIGSNAFQDNRALRVSNEYVNIIPSYIIMQNCDMYYHSL